MATSDTVTLYHAPNSRSSAALTLLEELGAPYRLHVLNLNAGDQRQPAYLAVNPMGKVPAITHGDALITEQVAIFIYLADLFLERGARASDRRSAARPVPTLACLLRKLFRAGDRRSGAQARARAAAHERLRRLRQRAGGACGPAAQGTVHAGRAIFRSRRAVGNRASPGPRASSSCPSFPKSPPTSAAGTPGRRSRGARRKTRSSLPSTRPLPARRRQQADDLIRPRLMFDRNIS